jgi:rhamnose utilization protein RhaD (predicted bifunctional aldolase and dehydrogenase)
LTGPSISRDRPEDEAEYSALRRLSARLGRDPLRTQAAGGNTSLKRDGVMAIKASGTWLADAESREIMVPVALEPLLTALAAGDDRAETATAFVVDGSGPRGLRPSVETPVHAVIGFPVVVHIHCVATIALAVRQEAEALIAERLTPIAGVTWALVPYIRPGVPLAGAIAGLDPQTNVIVLGNHGLVVAADTVAEADSLLGRVIAAFDAPRRTAAPADLAELTRLTQASPYRLPSDPLAHDVAMDQASLAIARQGTLYPDHVVFLGPGIVVLRDEETPAGVAQRLAAEGRAPPPMLVFPGRGVLLHRDVLSGADELARGLAEVTGRIPDGAAVHGLASAQESELVSWDAEIYRLAQAREKGAEGADTGAK